MSLILKDTGTIMRNKSRMPRCAMDKSARLWQKRPCSGLGGRGHVEYGVVVDTPMDTWDAPNHSPQNGHSASVPGMVLPAPGRGAGQHCPRCMAGEPGHINHIMRY
ncbi:uncharacterized protein si:ch211-221j21.3 isoform X2 [Megalobrama amblycephala]|uniref:uncharacterized protein si:ch211-221j21.3 isoform X2 n=1 Tax=Megalobrama amblycephala TaxID=75352 RepID=UPI0020141B5F|nr:uncharacterized protein si:ch211-221j21.3 isoform X2 [Megalobrama amblycephala]